MSGYISFAGELPTRMGYHPTGITIGDRKGKVRAINGIKIAVAKSELQFRIAVLDEVHTFLTQIGFADTVKQRKARVAVELIRKHGHVGAVKPWRMAYVKEQGVWT